MKIERKIAMVFNHTKMEDEDSLDVAFWLSKTPAERLAEVCRLRNHYFAGANGLLPEKIEKVVHQVKYDI